MELQMNIAGKVLEKIKSSGPKVTEIFGETMRDASTVVMEATIQEAPSSIGALRQSIRRELSDSGLKAEIFPSVKYGEDLHGKFEGGPERSAPRFIPVREAQEGGSLYRWAKKKGINPFAVRASIGKKGVKYNKFMKRAADSTAPRVEKIFSTGIERVAKYFSD